LVATHVGSFVTSGNYYSGYKLLSETYFVLTLAVAAPLAANARWSRCAGLAVVMTWLALAGFASKQMVPCAHDAGYVVSYSELRAALESHAAGRPVGVLCLTDQPLWIVNLIAGESSISSAVLTPRQLI